MTDVVATICIGILLYCLSFLAGVLYACLAWERYAKQLGYVILGATCLMSLSGIAFAVLKLL